MSRQLQGVEKGFRIYQENSDTHVDWLVGTAAPVGTGDQASAPIGSIYQRIGTGEIYQKIANAGAPADWELNGSGSSNVLPVFKNIVVRAATNDTVAAGTVDPTSFSDNESGLDGNDFSVGEYLLGDVDGTPALFEVTVVTGAADITVAAASPALAENDGLIVRRYLPDSPAGQENTAGVMFQSGAIVKLFDVDWSVATAITLSGSYTAVNGTVGSGDSVEAAVQKLDGNQQDIQTLQGVSQGSTDLGTFTGTTIPDAQTVKQALQSVETALEEIDQNVDDLVTLSGVAENAVNNGTMDQGEILSDNATTNALLKEADAELTRQRGKSSSTGITTASTIDSVLVDDVANAQWLVTVENAASPANKRHFSIFAGHNGHASADATSADTTVTDILKQGANFNYSVSAVLNGAGASQEMRLQVSSTEPSGVNVYAKRIETLF